MMSYVYEKRLLTCLLQACGSIGNVRVSSVLNGLQEGSKGRILQTAGIFYSIFYSLPALPALRHTDNKERSGLMCTQIDNHNTNIDRHNLID